MAVAFAVALAPAAAAARASGAVTGVGYNYRWAPLVQYAKQLIADGRLGEITNYRGRFFSMYGSDPLGLLSWRFLVDKAGYGVTSDLMTHSVDLAHMLIGPIRRVVGTTATFIGERPLPVPGERQYIFLSSKPNWVEVPKRGQRFREFPREAIIDWHKKRKLLVP